MKDRAASRKGPWTARLVRLSARLPARAPVIGGLSQGILSVTAALVAYVPTKPLGLQEGFWGSITAIAVVQTELSAARTSARDQLIGAAIGGTFSGLIVTLWGQHLASYAVTVVVAMLACWIFNVSTAARLAGTTTTIILLVPHQGPAEWMVLSRIAEVAWGVTVGFSTVWFANRVEKLVSGAKA